MLAVYNSFGQVMWTILVVFAWILFFWLLFAVFGDLFQASRRQRLGEGSLVDLCDLPPFGCFVYLITQGRQMGERRMQEAQAAQAQLDDRVRAVAGSGNSAEQIAKAKDLLDSGAITQAEFDQLKTKALA